MSRMRSLLILGVEFVVQVDEIVVQVIVEIVIVVVQVVVVQVVVIIYIVSVAVVVFVPLLVVVEIFVVVFEIVLEVFVLRIVVRSLFRQPRLRPPIVLVQEAPRGLQHGAHYRNLLVVRQKRARD